VYLPYGATCATTQEVGYFVSTVFDTKTRQIATNWQTEWVVSLANSVSEVDAATLRRFPSLGDERLFDARGLFRARHLLYSRRRQAVSSLRPLHPSLHREVAHQFRTGGQDIRSSNGFDVLPTLVEGNYFIDRASSPEAVATPSRFSMTYRVLYPFTSAKRERRPDESLVTMVMNINRAGLADGSDFARWALRLIFESWQKCFSQNLR